MSGQRPLLGALALGLLLLATGCASSLQAKRLTSAIDELGQRTELVDVPFFPQKAYQCGPAATATVLTAAGASVTTEALVSQVYVPERRGTLQLGIVAAVRRHGYVPYVLDPQLTNLLREVAAGHPVLVLQNLALKWYPKWHYAVVVGFDLEKRQLILRSGQYPRHLTSLALFERTWRRGGYWAMVALAPAKLPVTAEEKRYIETVSALERNGHAPAAVRAYQTALGRWPESYLAWVGLGNSRYALADPVGAESAYRQAIRYRPQAASAHNNLALALAEQGRLSEAELAARTAVRLGGPLRESAEHTLQDILAKRNGLRQ